MNSSSLISFNAVNVSCSFPLKWNSTVVTLQKPIFFVCIVALFAHSIFWLQFVFCASVRQTSMQWLYAYLGTDILLLARFFFLFAVHTLPSECVPNSSWATFICYFEATVDNYLNLLEAYILFVLNVCRYMQIAHNRNVYATHVRLLIFAHISIYMMPLIIIMIQSFLGWAVIVPYTGGSCDVAFPNGYVQAFNIIISFALPIMLNIAVIYASMRHVHLTSRLRTTQHHVSARSKYHRSMVIQFLVFYTIWLSLWSPNIVVFQITSGQNTLTRIAQLLNYIEIALDPIIISALDVRFGRAWRQSCLQFMYRIFPTRAPNQRRIQPLVVAWSRNPQV